MSPTSPLSPCVINGCPGRAVSAGRCSVHLAEYRRKLRDLYPDSRPTSVERGYDAEWRKVRNEIMSKSPSCQVVNCPEMAHHLHHEPEYPTLGKDHRLYQLIPLCTRHHNQITGERHPWARNVG